MRCAHCTTGHDTVAQTRLCAERNNYATAPREERPMRPYKPSEQRREASRQDQFEEVNMLGDRLNGGWYAVRNVPGTAHNDISFYQVDKPDRGRWAGKTFVRQLLGAPRSFREERIPLARQLFVLRAVVADEQGAIVLFGKSLGFCSVCHSPLTNEKSRARGIGPDCARTRGYTDVA
jgi:hypothetical protein